MKPKIISFDLQGTLSDAAFSDEFWLELLPKYYSSANHIPIQQAKDKLAKEFTTFGKYDQRYYDASYWMVKLTGQYSFEKIRQELRQKPKFYQDILPLLEQLYKQYNLIIISSTTNDFISAELGEFAALFTEKFSSFDTFHIPGKPPELYTTIAQELKVRPEEILHIGDSYDMDIANAQKAGVQTFLFDRSQREKSLKNLKLYFMGLTEEK